MPTQPVEYEFHVDGEPYTIEDFTFGEQRLLRQTVRELADDPDLDLLLSQGMDRFPAMYWIVKRRTQPDLTLESVLDTLNPEDCLREVKKEPRRPTAAAKEGGSKKGK